MKKAIAIFLTVSLIFSITCISGITASANMPPSGTANLTVIDISGHNTNGSDINWTTLAANIDAIYIKATEGTTFTNQYASWCATSAQSAGIKYGFYHYFWPNSNLSQCVAEADYFYNFIKNYSYNCYPVIDVEEANGLTKAQVSASVKAFADEIKRLSGKDVMIYTGPYFANSYLDTSFSAYRLWIAQYNTYVMDSNIWNQWDMWQYTDALTVPGMPGPVDGDKATSNIFMQPYGQTYIDKPTNTTYYGDIAVSGWAVSHAGMSSVDVYIDGKELSCGYLHITSLSERADVQATINADGYYIDGLHSGYSFTIPARTLSNGTHTIYIAGVADDGSVEWAQQSFTVATAAPRTCIDSPTNTTYYGDISVKGWAASSPGIDRVDIYLDGQALANGFASITTLGVRQDVQDQVNYDNRYTDALHSGFTCTIPAGHFTDGTHTVYIAAISNDGSVQWSSQQITVATPAPRTCIDSPTNTTYPGSILVSGWAASRPGIDRVDIYLDGKALANGFCSITTLTERQDVQNAVNYDNRYTDALHSGFAATIPDGRLSNGVHTVWTAAISNDGSVQWSSQTFTVS